MSEETTDTEPLTIEQARSYAARWVETQDVHEEIVAIVVLARVMRGEGLAAVAIESAAQSAHADAAADAGLLAYEGHGDWALTEAGARVLSPAEREQLFAWVRARMAKVHSESLSPRDDMVMEVAVDLGLLHSSGLPMTVVRDICTASGWPS